MTFTLAVSMATLPFDLQRPFYRSRYAGSERRFLYAVTRKTWCWQKLKRLANLGHSFNGGNACMACFWPGGGDEHKYQTLRNTGGGNVRIFLPHALLVLTIFFSDLRVVALTPEAQATDTSVTGFTLNYLMSVG